MILWFLPPRVLTIDLLEQELKDTALLVNQISQKYEKRHFEGRSPLMRRFYNYQPYVFLRNKIVAAQILHETGQQRPYLPKTVLKFGNTYYNPSESLIQLQCSEVIDFWEKTQNTSKLSEFSLLTTNDIRQELNFLFNIYKSKYQL